MSNPSPIEAVVPKPWRTIGRVYTLIGIASSIGFLWWLFFCPEPPDGEAVFIACVNFIAVPIFTIFALPLFLNRYPAWVVRLIGPKYLHKFIADCKQKLGKDRAEKAHILMPHTWFDDKRFFWIVTIVGLAILGVLRGVGWL
jgi:hypothetical protein